MTNHSETRRLSDEWSDPPSREEQLVTAVARGKREILEDVASGRVPADVASFGDLHDHVDANEYGGLCEDGVYGDGLGDDERIQFGNDVQDTLDSWIKEGMPREEPLDLTSAEYATIAEALDFLADLDEGENTDRDELWRLAQIMRGAAGPQPPPEREMSLVVLVDGDELATLPLVDEDGDDGFNAASERGALDRAYEAAESDPTAVVTIHVNTNGANR